MDTRPSRLRLLAAIVTSATATFLLAQVLQTSEAEEPPPAANAPVVARAENPPPAPPAPLMLPDPPPPKPTVAPKRKSVVRKLLPVRDFGGY